MKLYKYYFFILVSFLFFSCKKETGNTISIVGFVELVDENGVGVINREGVLVKAQTTNSTNVTDQNGRFQLNDLVAGNVYSLDFSKDSYGTLHINTPKFVGDQKPGLINPTTLYQIPVAFLLNSSIVFKNDSIIVKGEFSPPRSNYMYAMIFANDSVDVSEKHYDYASWIDAPIGGYHYANPFSLDILVNNKYKAGTIVYVALYFYNPLDYGEYNDKTDRIERSSGKKMATFQVTL